MCAGAQCCLKLCWRSYISNAVSCAFFLKFENVCVLKHSWPRGFWVEDCGSATRHGGLTLSTRYQSAQKWVGPNAQRGGQRLACKEPERLIPVCLSEAHFITRPLILLSVLNPKPPYNQLNMHPYSLLMTNNFYH